jgi:hypothetical protein
MKLQIECTYTEIAVMRLALLQIRNDYKDGSIGQEVIDGLTPRLADKMTEFVNQVNNLK